MTDWPMSSSGQFGPSPLRKRQYKCPRKFSHELPDFLEIWLAIGIRLVHYGVRERRSASSGSASILPLFLIHFKISCFRDCSKPHTVSVTNERYYMIVKTLVLVIFI